MKRTLTTITCAILLLLLFSCTSHEYGVIDGGKDSVITASKVSIGELVKNLSNMEGKYVEVKGRFSFNFEDVALYDYGFFSDNNTCFWLDLSSKVFSGNDEVLRKLNGKKVTVKGRLNIHRQGHLGDYLATLEDVYYMVQK